MSKTETVAKIHNYDSLSKSHQELIAMPNQPLQHSNGIYERYKNPILTAAHTPLEWRYDLNAKTNPFGMERIGINATFNAGAIKFNGSYVLAVRVEGADRKSFIAIAAVTAFPAMKETPFPEKLLPSK